MQPAADYRSRRLKPLRTLPALLEQRPQQRPAPLSSACLVTPDAPSHPPQHAPRPWPRCPFSRAAPLAPLQGRACLPFGPEGSFSDFPPARPLSPLGVCPWQGPWQDPPCVKGPARQAHSPRTRPSFCHGTICKDLSPFLICHCHENVNIKRTRAASVLLTSLPPASLRGPATGSG